VVASDCYAAPRVKLALGANQVARPELLSLASTLHLATYRIVVALYPAMPDLLSADVGAQAASWLEWSDSPARDWKDVCLPRLQSFLAFQTAVLPAGSAYD